VRGADRWRRAALLKTNRLGLIPIALAPPWLLGGQKLTLASPNNQGDAARDLAGNKAF